MITAPSITELQANAQKIIFNHLAAIGCDEFTATRVFVVGSPRIRPHSSCPPFIDFEIDEKRGDQWFRVTYSLLLDDDGTGDTLLNGSPSGLPHWARRAGEELTIGLHHARSPESANKCNGYDLAFLAWFQRDGWQIHQTPSGIDVWTNGDAFTVTRGMIERLEWNDHIERIFPPHAATLDYVWINKTS
jgi:hypothetical protein